MTGEPFGGSIEPEPAEPGSESAANVAISLALAQAGKGSRRSAAGAGEAASYLRKQERLLDLQLRHFEEERRLRLSDMRLKRLSDGLKVAFEVSLAFVGLLFAISLGAAIWTAARADSVVVDAFSGPPDLAAKGLTGEVLASSLLDNLTLIQSQTRSAQTKRGLRDAWSGDIKLEVPETGVSIGEMMRFLRAWLGRETHISGDLVETPDGLSLTVRGAGILPKTFTGPPADLGKLVTQAAEYVYGQAEPYIFSSYLQSNGRDAEAIAFIPSVYQSSRPVEQPYLLNAWGIGLLDVGRPRDALVKFRQALSLKPDYWIAYNNVMNSLWGFGDEEGVWRTAQAMKQAAGGRPGRAPDVYYQNVDQVTWDLPALRLDIANDMKLTGGAGTAITPDGLGLAEADALLHDPGAAELDLATTPGVATDPSGGVITHFVAGYGALDRGDFASAARELEAMSVGYANPIVAGNFPGLACWLAPAEEMAGHPDKADAALKAGGHFVDCYRFKGDLLDHRGDWPGAQQAYAAAVALAPDLPAGYYSWGLALARHRDLAAATAKYALANSRSPHWADPLEAWGDALAAQGKWKEAADKYAQALRYAPAWAALRRESDAGRRRTDKN